MTTRMAPLGMIGLGLLMLANVWLLAELAQEVMSDGHGGTDKVDWTFNRSTPVGSATSRKPVESYAQILSRPVFFRSREPFVPAPPQPPRIQTPSQVVIDPGLVLGGIMIKGDVRKAFIFSRAQAEGAWVSERGTYMGWEMRSISATGARLEQQGRSIELQLYALSNEDPEKHIRTGIPPPPSPPPPSPPPRRP